MHSNVAAWIFCRVFVTHESIVKKDRVSRRFRLSSTEDKSVNQTTKTTSTAVDPICSALDDVSMLLSVAMETSGVGEKRERMTHKQHPIWTHEILPVYGCDSLHLRGVG